eukprot:c5107_g1_i1.p1 GENE.c5107_g1_i1~~c5107_g1_i1.p1  ORF type:complete len:1182 (-),score=262.23 c5107_g1_i1:244-3789(-)
MTDQAIRKKEEPIENQASFVGGFLLAGHYVWADVKRTHLSLVLGISTVTIVVASLVFLQSIVGSVVPLVFMRLAEQSVSESDMIMRPEGTQIFMNQTNVQLALQNNPNVVGSTPRWALPARAVSRTDANVSLEAYFFVIDSKQEKNIKLGRAFDVRVINEQEAYISSDIADRLGVQGNVGDRIYVEIDLGQLAGTADLNIDSLFPGASVLFGNNSNVLDSSTVASALGINLDQQFEVSVGNNQNLVNAVDALQGLLVGNLTLGLNTTAILDQLLSVGTVTVTGQNIADFVTTNLLGVNSPSLSLATATLPKLRVEVIVLASVSKPEGKWPELMGNVVVLDSFHLPALLANMIYHTPSLRRIQSVLDVISINSISLDPEPVQNVLNNPNDYSFLVTVQNKNRLRAYTMAPNLMKLDVISFADSIYESLGIDYLAENYVPVADFIVANQFLVVLFGQNFLIIDVVLILLGCILVFTLMLDSITEKAYEYGMLQALGMLKHTLAKLLLVQSAVYAIPGTALGIFFGWVLFSALGSIVIAPYAAIKYPDDFQFPMTAPLLGLCLGLVIPFAANIVPIRQAISGTLRDALDVSHQSFSETRVKIERLERLNMRPSEIAFSLACLFIGFLSYYMFPFAMLYQMWDLAFAILTVIIITMVLGLAVIAAALQAQMEAGVCFLIVRFKDAHLRPLVQRNLVSHRKRTYKTAIMVTLSFAFLVFASALRISQFSMITDTLRVFYGSDIRITSLSTTSPLDRPALAKILDREKALPHSIVKDYSFATYSLLLTDTVSDTRETNLGQYPSADVDVVGVEANILSVVDLTYFSITELDPAISYRQVHGKPDVVRSMYDEKSHASTQLKSFAALTSPVEGLGVEDSTQTTQGQLQDIVDRLNTEYIDCIASESIRKYVSVDTQTFHQLITTARKVNPNTGSQPQRSRLVRPRAIVSKLPGFSFSGYKSLAQLGWSDMLVSIDAYQSILQEMQNVSRSADPSYQGNEQVKYKDLFIALHPNAPSTNISALADTLKTAISSGNAQVLKLDSVISSLNEVSNFVGTLFYFTIVIASILCLFSLFLSVYGNVRENSWEYGVLRALGVGASSLQRAYIYEALSVVLAAVANGTVVGIIIALILALFTTAWTELPLRWTFPGDVYGILLAIALLVVFVGTYVPTRNMNRLSIANVIRGTRS